MAAAGFLHSSKSGEKSSTQGWSPNSGQVGEDASRNPYLVLASEHEQQSSASNLTLPQQQNQLGGTQTQSASLLDQPQNGSVQYQPTGNNPEPPTTDALGQYQPTGNNETPLAGDDLNSNVIDKQSTDSPHQPRRRRAGTGRSKCSRRSDARRTNSTRH